MSTITKLICNNFGGIRRKDAFFSSEKITCSDCQNVELFYTKLNSGIGVRTTSGNMSVSDGYDNKNCNTYILENDTMISVSKDGKINVYLQYLELKENGNEYRFERDTSLDLTLSGNKYYAFKQNEPVNSYVYSNLIKYVGSISKNFEKVSGFSESNYISYNMQEETVLFNLVAGQENVEANVLNIVQDEATQTFIQGSYFDLDKEYNIVVSFFETTKTVVKDEETGETEEVPVYNYEVKYKSVDDADFTMIGVFSSDKKGIAVQIKNLNGYVNVEKSKIGETVLAYEQFNTRIVYYTDKLGNNIINLIPPDEKIIEIFESVQCGRSYMFVYTESATEGKLYNMAFEIKSLDLLIDGLTVTGKASGVDFSQGWLDMFIFSNGEEMKYIYSNADTDEILVIESADNIKLTDAENRNVKGLGLVVFDSRLWVFDGKVLWYSKQEECRDFKYNDASTITSAGYIEFVKDITAIYPYLGSLAVFHKDSSVLVVLDENTIFAKTDESPGGCASYKSLVFHGTDLYFYDDVKKGVFSFKQIINGDKTLGENIALDIQQELMEIKPDELDKIRTLSVVTSDRNEVWFLLPISTDEKYSIVLIYDYLRGEWLKRKCQHINTINVVDGTLFSGYQEILEEYIGNTFNGEFIESFYTCSMFNLGEENTMKITKFPPRLIVDGNILSHFWIKYVKNYNYYKKAKTKEVKSKISTNVLTYDSGEYYDSSYIYIPNKLNTIVKMPSSTFKALEITFYTVSTSNQFAIKSIEFSELKVKQV